MTGTLRLLLKAEGYRIEAVSNPGAVLAALETQDFDILLIDLNYARDTTSGREGLDQRRHRRSGPPGAGGGRDPRRRATLGKEPPI